MTAPTVAGGHARLLVPFAALALVAFALNASWHAIQGTLRALEAPDELVLALPVILEPAALIYAWVTIDRTRTGRETTDVRRWLVAALMIAVAYNVASALPLDVLLPPGSSGRMVALAVSAALAPLTVVSVGHTALEEATAWRASRRSLADDVHAALETEAQQALSGRLREEFAAEVHTAVLARLRAEMARRLGMPDDCVVDRDVRGVASGQPDSPVPARQTSADTLPDTGVSDTSGVSATPGESQVAVTRTVPLPATAMTPLDHVPDRARPVVERYLSAGGDVNDPELTAAIVDACAVTDRTARRYLAPLRANGPGSR